MKLPITDQFLWDLYDTILEKVGDAAGFMLSNPYRQSFLLFNDNPAIGKYKKKMNRQQFSKLVYHLKKHNHIKVQNLKGKQAIILTKEGVDKAIKAKFKIEGRVHQKRKDGKWIMIIFDIPQHQWKTRTLLKSILYNLGYKKFQQSVWITPYDVYKKTEQSLQFYLLDRYVRIFLIEEMP